MAGRVNLNVPPRLIESARAAQYANREAQGARELARKIESKVRQQRQAAKRAQPQAQTIDGQGAVFDAPALKRVPRIWRKRRPLVGGGYGVGWLANNNVLSTPVYTNGVTCGGYSINVVVDDVLNPGLPTYFNAVRTCGGSEAWAGSVEIKLFIGSGNAETWLTDTVSLDWVFSIARNIREYQNTDTGQNFLLDGTVAISSNNSFALWFFTLPAGNDAIVLLLSVVRYVYGESTAYGWSGGPAITSSTATRAYSVEGVQAYLVERETVKRLPGITQLPALFDNKISASANTAASGGTQAIIGQAWEGSSLGINAAGLPGNARAFTSASFLYNLNPNQFSAEIALQEYAIETGSTQIPVIGYRRVSVGPASPLTEQGVLGVMPGATVTTQPVLPTVLEDEFEQKPASNAVALGTDHEMVIAYDYHGGTYCRDQLAALGITLP